MASGTEERRVRVLLVDDNDSFREMLVTWLAARYETAQASSAAAGLAAMRAARPDLALLDIMMPGVSGIDMFRTMAADPELATVPVVFLTAYHQALSGDDEELLARCRVVLKPFRFEELAEQLDLALKERQPPAVW